MLDGAVATVGVVAVVVGVVDVWVGAVVVPRQLLDTEIQPGK